LSHAVNAQASDFSLSNGVVQCRSMDLNFRSFERRLIFRGTDDE